MRCCVRCFQDGFLKRYLREHGRIGTCQFCRARRVHVIKAGDLNDLFARFTELYPRLEPGLNAPQDVDMLERGERLATIIQGLTFKANRASNRRFKIAILRAHSRDSPVTQFNNPCNERLYFPSPLAVPLRTAIPVLLK